MNKITILTFVVLSTFSNALPAARTDRTKELQFLVKGTFVVDNSDLISLAFLRNDCSHEQGRDFRIAIVATDLHSESTSKSIGDMCDSFALASTAEDQPAYKCTRYYSNNNKTLLYTLVEEIIHDKFDAIITIGSHCSSMVVSQCLTIKGTIVKSNNSYRTIPDASNSSTAATSEPLKGYTPLFISLDKLTLWNSSDLERSFWTLFNDNPLCIQGNDYYSYLEIDPKISSSDIEALYLTAVCTAQRIGESEINEAIVQLQQADFSNKLCLVHEGEIKIDQQIKDYTKNVIEPLKILADPVLRILHDSFFGINHQKEND